MKSFTNKKTSKCRLKYFSAFYVYVKKISTLNGIYSLTKVKSLNLHTGA